MRCPYCRISLHEYTPECPNCKLTYHRVNSLLGVVPRLSSGLDGAASLLNAREMKAFTKAVTRIKIRFPQINNHLIVRNLPDKFPFELYLFWFFNSAGLSEAAHKGGENRDVLLLLDPTQNRAGITVGYGLEPYLKTDALDHLLALAAPAFKEKRWLDGFLEIYNGLDQLLEAAAIQVQEATGISTKMNAKRRSQEY